MRVSLQCSSPDCSEPCLLIAGSFLEKVQKDLVQWTSSFMSLCDLINKLSNVHVDTLILTEKGIIVPLSAHSIVPHTGVAAQVAIF